MTKLFLFNKLIRTTADSCAKIYSACSPFPDNFLKLYVCHLPNVVMRTPNFSVILNDTRTCVMLVYNY